MEETYNGLWATIKCTPWYILILRLVGYILFFCLSPLGIIWFVGECLLAILHKLTPLYQFPEVEPRRRKRVIRKEKQEREISPSDFSPLVQIAKLLK